MPSQSAKTSAVCSPNSGDGLTGAGAPSKRTGKAGIRKVAGGVLHGLDDAALGKARLGQQIAGVEHRPGRHAGGADQPHRLVLVMPQRPFGHHRLDLGFVPGARLARRKARIVEQLGLPDTLRAGAANARDWRGW